jgi:glutamate/aspartate transport system substrate-binding protein
LKSAYIRLDFRPEQIPARPAKFFITQNEEHHPCQLSTLSKITAGLIASALLAAPAISQELTGTLKKIKDSGTITIGHRETSVPFSYLDDKQQPIGYSMDLCAAIVEEGKKNCPPPSRQVQPVTSQTRIP